MALFHHAEREAAKQRELAVQQWQLIQSTYDDALATLVAVRNGSDGQDRLSAPINLAAGEAALWGHAADLIEPRIQGGSWQGRSQGVSFHVAKGVNYRVGANRGHYVPGPEMQTPVDEGRCVVTTKRVLFLGSKITREWQYAKLLDQQASVDGSAVMLPVSNRQKVSGLAAGPALSDWVLVGSTVAAHGIEEAIGGVQGASDDHRASPPPLPA